MLNAAKFPELGEVAVGGQTDSKGNIGDTFLIGGERMTLDEMRARNDAAQAALANARLDQLRMAIYGGHCRDGYPEWVERAVARVQAVISASDSGV